MTMKKSLIFLFILLIFLTACSSNVPIIEERLPILIMTDNSCDWEQFVPEDHRIFVEDINFTILGIKAKETSLNNIRSNECVIHAGIKEDVEQTIRDDLGLDRDERIKKADLKRTLQNNDLLDRDELDVFIEDENPQEDWPGGVISAYQLYVTPNAPAVKDKASDLNGIQNIYDESLSWVWISEEDLNGVIEKWLFPQEFLTNTPSYDTNPTSEIASDCEEQANTLASILISDGYDPQNVRVVLGLVDFDGEIGGHAWVQVYEEDKWFDMEATAGSYYIDGEYVKNSDYLPYDYFKYVDFPSLEIWAYYSNEYYQDEESDISNSPPHWEQESVNWLDLELDTFNEPGTV
jgi:hypothetical protein